jgi:hypothetical protein
MLIQYSQSLNQYTTLQVSQEVREHLLKVFQKVLLSEARSQAEGLVLQMSVLICLPWS